MNFGVVKKVLLDKGFGFIAPDQPSGRDVFFHRSALAGGLEWSDALQGQCVAFDTEVVPKGLRATIVQPAE